MSDIVIEARDLTKRYGSTTAVDGVSFTVGRGEIFGLLGPNGAGKTTTLLMTIGLTNITSGSVSILGHDPVREPLQVKSRIGYLPDSVGFYDHLTAVENLNYTARLNGFAFSERGPRIAAALGRAGLSDVGQKRVGTFSHGMRQRLGLAEIFMKNVAIAILDEPTSGLDPQATAGFLESIRVLKHDGVAVLMSSHLLTQVQSICDRVALFNAGRIALIGSVPELANQVLGGGYHVQVEAEGPMLAEKLAAVSGVRVVEPVGPGRFRLLAEGDVRPQAAAAVVNAGGALRGLSFEQPSLGEIYSHYFQNQGAHKAKPHAARTFSAGRAE
jgi:ABC-2 type transport system ATP-binding protein